MSSQRPDKIQKKRERKARKRRERLKGKTYPIDRPGGAFGDTILIEPPGYEKMSVVFEDFFEPYMELAESTENIGKMMFVGAMAWNIALRPEGEQQREVEE